MTTDAIDLMEFEAVENVHTSNLQATALVSIAISLKRIADALGSLPHDLVSLAEQAKIKF